MLAKDVLSRAQSALEAAGIDTPALDARMLLEHALGRSREWVAMNPQHVLTHAQAERYETLIQRRRARQPVSQIVGKREFWSMEFIVTPDVLTPRPDSETLVEAVLEHVKEREKPFRILDIGTGSGCLLLALLRELPQAGGIGTDRSPEALRVAARNAEKLGFAERSGFLCAFWSQGVKETFDIIVSNPPYIATGDIGRLGAEVAGHEPVEALDGGPDGFQCYRDIVQQLPGVMARNALVALEIGRNQDEGVAHILTQRGLRVIGLKPDLSGIRRCLLARQSV